jgi:3-hydroxyisobutyrate dehydrogenase-like beta-hydroxyacid dehydrogenase
MKVGFAGLGRMGFGMALSLLKAGHEVTVYNRTASKSEALLKQGAIAASCVAEVCAGDTVITMLANDAAVESIFYGDQGLRASLREGAVHVSCSTISVSLSARLTREHADVGQRFVAAPVFGRPDVAVAGELAVIAAGDKGAIEDVKPLLDAVGRRTFVISDQPKAASLVKLSGNFLIASVIEALGEAIALTRKRPTSRSSVIAARCVTFTLESAPRRA